MRPAQATLVARTAVRTAAEVVLTPIAIVLALGRALVRRPSILVAVTILLVCYPSDNTNVAASVHVTPIDIGTAFVVLAAAVRLLSGDRPLSSRAWLLFSGVTVALGLATLTSFDTAGSLSGFIRYAQLFVLVPIGVIVALRDRKDLMLVGFAVVAVGVIEGAVGVWQTVTHTGASYAGSTSSSNIRAVGTFGALDVMGMAVVVGYGLLTALALGLVLRGRARVVLLTIAALLVLPLVFSLSRGSWIATTCGAVLVLTMAGWRLALRTAVIALALAVVVVGGFGVGSATIGQRFGSILSSTSAPDQSVTDRYDLWDTAVSIWEDHPVTGVGIKQFPAFLDSDAPLSLSSYSDAEDPTLGYQREPLLSPHNMYFLILSEQGLVGIAAFGGLFLVLVVESLRRTRNARAPAFRAGGLAVSGFLVSQLIDFLYADIGGASTVLMSVMFGIAAWWALPARDHELAADEAALESADPIGIGGVRVRPAFPGPLVPAGRVPVAAGSVASGPVSTALAVSPASAAAPPGASLPFWPPPVPGPAESP